MTTTAPPAARWLTDGQQRVWRAYLLGSALLSERLDAQLREHDLDLAEYEILVTLSESADRQLRMAELADAVHQSRSRLTHTVTRMEKRGLIERTTCPVDRRGVWANLTDDGFALLAATGGHKPFECVGEETETVAALRLLADQPAWRDHAVVARFAREG